MFTIQPVTERQLKDLGGKLAQSGTTVHAAAEHDYRIEGHGITAKATFDRAAGALTVNVIDKPFYIPESAIESRLRNALKDDALKA